MPNENQRQLWLNEALLLVSEIHGRDGLREYLTPLLRRCHSNSKKAFWQFLRLTLARNPDTVDFLHDMQECRVPPEVAPKTTDGFEYTVSEDGSTVLIPVGDAEHHGIWKIPVTHLEWAKAQRPVWLKQLPTLEPPELKRQREIQHKLRYMRRYMTASQLASLRQEVNDLDAQVNRAYEPVPRYCLMKSEGGRDISVHRLFLGVAPEDEVEIIAFDDDFLNFTTTKVRVTMEPVPDKDGIAGGRGKSETLVIEASNIQVAPRSEEKQTKFEKNFLPYKITPQGDISQTPLKVMVNADLGKRTGCHGVNFGDAPVVVDCGLSAPLTAEERYSPERFRGKPRKTLDADTIRRRWRGF